MALNRKLTLNLQFMLFNACELSLCLLQNYGSSVLAQGSWGRIGEGVQKGNSRDSRSGKTQEDPESRQRFFSSGRR
jgi:hypothetical protein